MKSTIHTGMYGNKAFLLMKAFYTNFSNGYRDHSSKYSWARNYDDTERAVSFVSFPETSPSGEIVVQVDTSKSWNGDEYFKKTSLGNPSVFKQWIANKLMVFADRARTSGKSVKIRDVTTFPAYSLDELKIAVNLLVGNDISGMSAVLRSKWAAGDVDPVRYELTVACGEEIERIKSEFEQKRHALVCEFRRKRREALATIAKEKRHADAELGKALRKAISDAKKSYNPALPVTA